MTDRIQFVFIRFKYPREHGQEKQEEYAEGDQGVDINAADLFEIVNEFHIRRL
jgi:hypothetical protein